MNNLCFSPLRSHPLDPNFMVHPVNECFSGTRALTFMPSRYPVHGALFSAAKVLEASYLHKVDPRRAGCIWTDIHVLPNRHIIEQALRPPPMAVCKGTAHKLVRLSKREPPWTGFRKYPELTKFVLINRKNRFYPPSCRAIAACDGGDDSYRNFYGFSSRVTLTSPTPLSL